MIVDPALVLNDEKLKHKRRMQKIDHKKCFTNENLPDSAQKERVKEKTSHSKRVVLKQVRNLNPTQNALCIIDD